METREREILDILSKRYSPRAFSEKAIELNKVDKLFEAARWAASSHNAQPWRFIYAANGNKPTYDLLFDCLTEHNQDWVKFAPLLILTLTRKTYEHKNRPYKHAWHDLGLAVGNMTAQAMSMGLYLHPMGGFDSEKVIVNFNIPDEYEPVTMIAAGYLGDVNILPEELKQREIAERKRKLLSDIVFQKPF